jgi:hypothetical protein
MSQENLKTAQRHLLERRRYFIDQLAQGPVVVDDLIRWLFDTQRAIEVLQKVDLEMLAVESAAGPSHIEANEGEKHVQARELYRSSTGDRWLLVRDISGAVFVRHEPNHPSGGQSTKLQIGSFLSGGYGPEHAELLHLIGTLVDAQTVDGVQ